MRCSLLYPPPPHTALVQSRLERTGTTRSRVRDTLIRFLIALYATTRHRCRFNFSLNAVALDALLGAPLCVLCGISHIHMTPLLAGRIHFATLHRDYVLAQLILSRVVPTRLAFNGEEVPVHLLRII